MGSPFLPYSNYTIRHTRGALTDFIERLGIVIAKASGAVHDAAEPAGIVEGSKSPYHIPRYSSSPICTEESF
jgi:hypothetical protein